MRADRSKVVDLFAVEFDHVSSKPTAPKKKSGKATGKSNTNNKARMLAKLELEDYASFDEKDWFQYFVFKAEENGVKYLARNYAKDYTIIKSILSELAWTELKLMIDFIWDSNQDIHPKQTVGIWIISKGWINTIYQNALLWQDGKYRPKTAPTHNREWIAEASSKPSTGIEYGKPVKDSSEPQQKIKPKKKIKIGWDD